MAPPAPAGNVRHRYPGLAAGRGPLRGAAPPLAPSLPAGLPAAHRPQRLCRRIDAAG